MRDDQPELTPEILETLQGLTSDEASPAAAPANPSAPTPQPVSAPQSPRRSKPRSSASGSRGATATRQPRWRRRKSATRKTKPGKRRIGRPAVSAKAVATALFGLGLVVALALSSTRDRAASLVTTVATTNAALGQFDIEVTRLAEVRHRDWRSQARDAPLPNISPNLAAWEHDRRTRVNQLLPVVELLQTILAERVGSCAYRDLFDGDTINVAHLVSKQAGSSTSAGIEAYFDWVNEAAPIRPGVRLQITRIRNPATVDPSAFAWVTNLAGPNGRLNRQFSRACTPVLFSTSTPDSPSEGVNSANPFASSNLAFATPVEASIWASWAAIEHPDATRAVAVAADTGLQQLFTAHANTASADIMWFEDAATTARDLPDDPYDVIGLYGTPCPQGFTLESVDFVASECGNDANLDISRAGPGSAPTLIDPHLNPFGPGRYDVWSRWVRVLTANSSSTIYVDHYDREAATGIGMHGWVQVEALRQAEQLAAMRPDIPEVELLAIVATNLDVTLPSSEVRLRNSLVDNDSWLFEQGQIGWVVSPAYRWEPQYAVTVSRPG